MKRKTLERNFQKNLIKKIKKIFEGCLVLKNDPNYIQGIPDLLILYKDKWASLEVKKAKGSPRRPNQEYYVNLMNKMSFSRFVFPENEEDVILSLMKHFGVIHEI